MIERPGVIDVCLLALLLISGYTDLRCRKVYNAVTFPAIGIGLLLNPVLFGIPGLKSALIGFAVGFGLFLLIYVLGGIGGGDVKLVGAIGALGGYPFIVYAIFYSALVGGGIAVLELIWQKRLLRSLKNIFITIFSFLIPRMKTIPLDPRESIKVPYGFGIAAGTFWAWAELKIFGFSTLL